jgi:hypothetical protein
VVVVGPGGRVVVVVVVPPPPPPQAAPLTVQLLGEPVPAAVKPKPAVAPGAIVPL